MTDSTIIGSSEAGDSVKHHCLDLTTKYGHSSKMKILSDSIPSIQFEESDGIHVGNVIYNIHHHPQKTDLNEMARTPNTPFKFKIKKTFGLFGKYRSWKLYWNLFIITALVIICSAVSLSVYLILKGGIADDIETTTVIFNETTTVEPTITTTLDYFEAMIATREQWGAGELNTTKIPKLGIPIKRIIIGQTRGQFCANETSCIAIVKSLQTKDRTLDDIPYNFLIGGDGRIYEGRGIEHQGQHSKNLDATDYNNIGICIAFIGNYEFISPDSTQIRLLTDFIDFGKRKGLITDDYIFVLQDDLKYFETKSTALNVEIEQLANFRPLYKIYRREEWNAQRRKDDPVKFNRILSWVLIGHTEDILCTSLDDCKYLAADIQNYSFTRSWSDILYNVFIGGDGFAFEGRGFDYWGSHHSALNGDTIGVGAMGNFHVVPPNQAIIDAMLQVFDDAMALGKLTEDYKIFGRNDVGGPGPGAAFMDIIKGWCRYGNRTSPC